MKGGGRFGKEIQATAPGREMDAGQPLTGVHYRYHQSPFPTYLEKNLKL